VNKPGIRDLVARHAKRRGEGINLIASENLLPPEAAAVLVSDLQGRYHSAWYGGTGVVREIIARVEELACEVFGAKHAVVSAVSGNLCDVATLLALTKPGEGVAMLPFTAGGYPLNVELFGRRRVDLPVRPGTFEPDAGAGPPEEPFALVVGGASFLPFPHDLAGLTAWGRPVVYDGSHVMGLLASGVFQDPLREGALALIGSTHKSLFGPQGGIVLTDDDGAAEAYRAVLDLDLERGIGLVDNPHPARIAALGIVLEMLLEDRGYGGRVVQNAQALASALAAEGVPVRFPDRGYTASHQVFLGLSEEASKRYCALCEARGVFIDIGGRLGTAEATSRGLGPEDMKAVAETMASAYRALETA